MRICVVGTGYVGLVVGTGFAENGHFVTCVDKDPDCIAALSQGRPTIYEPGLEELMMRNAEEERLKFTSDLAAAIQDCLLIFLCVGTPENADGSPDLSQVYAAAEEIGKNLNGYRIIVSKSTCPVGTAEKIREIIRAQTEHPFDVVSNPEFLKEGAAVDDFMRPDRVVVGCDDVRVLEIMRELYAPFLRTGKPFIAMNVRSAELAKYATNCMLATRISLMNELAGIAEAYGADINQVREALMADARLGSTYLFPGLGFGGSCLPKDVSAACQLAREKNLPHGVLSGVIQTNHQQQAHFVQRIIEYYGGNVTGKRITIWGGSFKPRTDDIRNAPSLTVINRLLEVGAKITVYDPVANANLKKMYGDTIVVAPKMYPSIEGAQGLAVVTEWREFHFPAFEKMAAVMEDRVIFDGRNLYSPKTLEQHGFHYISIGRPAI